MKPTRSFVIELYIDEDEADLWSALQKIEPQMRSTFIKETLRQVLLNGVEAHKDNPVQSWDEAEKPAELDDNEEVDENEELEEHAEHEEFENLSLEALFTEERAHNPDEGMKVPWDYLLHTVIGVEDDESVITILKQAAHSEVQVEKPDNQPFKIDRSENPVDEPEEYLDRVENQEFDLKSLQVTTPILPLGFEYLMKHIIGKEDDEEVLKILQDKSPHRSAKRENQDSKFKD